MTKLKILREITRLQGIDKQVQELKKDNPNLNEVAIRKHLLRATPSIN